MASNIEMKRKKGMSRKAKTWLIISAIVIVAVASAAIYEIRLRANATSSYQTTIVERGSLTATIGATGNVRSSQTALINWQTSGTIQTVNVKVGDPVSAGDILASLSSTSLPQNVVLAQADIVTAQRNLDNLLHSSTQRAQAQLNLVNAQKSYESANANLNSLQSSNQSGTSADLENAQAQLVLAQRSYDQAKAMYDTVQNLPDTDASKAQAYTAVYNAQQALTRAQNNVNNFTTAPSGSDLDLARAKLSLAQAQLVDAQREWDRLKDGPDPKDLAAAQARVDAAQTTINSSRLIAPFAGVVTVAEPIAGDQISPGSSGFRVDDLERLLVDVRVSEVDINSVAVGQPVVITFDAAMEREYHGKVVEVSQVGTSVQSVVNFQVTVELTDKDINVKPGMTASVTIAIQSLENVLLVPNRAVHLVNSQRVVYVLRDGKLLEIPVVLGPSDNTNSEVTSGDLNPGDVLVLNPPANFTPGQGGDPGRMFGGG